jgi:TolA-binding protein
MSLTHLHPEDLFDKEARGTLTDDERVRLTAHVDQCTVCKMERVLRADFVDTDEERISYTSLVEGALGAVARAKPDAETKVDAKPDAAVELPAAALTKPEPEKNDAVVRTIGKPTAPWRRFALLFAAAFVLLCTAAAASPQGRSLAKRAGALLAADDEPRSKLETAPGTSPHAANATPSTAANGKVEGLATTAETKPAEVPSVLETATEAQPTAVALAQAAPVGQASARVEAPSAAHVTSAPLGQREPARAPSVAAVPTAPASVKAPEAPAAEVPARDEAGALFGVANDKRRAGDLTGALAGYADLVARFPASREAATARALRGRILLEQHDARRALTEFDAYLASGRGELREEALVGRARAFGLLGRTDSERTAWETLLSSYPSSASADHARLRLQTLGPR